MDCEHVRHSDKIDLTTWGFDTEHKLIDAVVGAIVTPIIQGEFNKSPPQITMPIYWSSSNDDGHNGPPVENPLTLDIQLPLGPSDDAVVYRTTLQEVIDDEFFDEDDDEVDRGKVARVADALERLAAKLRERLATENQK